MPITVSQKDYACAVGVHPDTVSRRLRDVPYTGGERNRQYHVAAVLPTLTARERSTDAVTCLFDAATTDETLYAGADVIPICHTFENWLDSRQEKRLTFCRALFTAGLYNSTVSSEIWQFIGTIQTRLVLNPAICRYVVTGAGPLPDFEHFALAFSVSNASYFDPIVNEEAA